MKTALVFIIAILVILILVVLFGSNTSEEITKYEIDPEVEEWLNNSNLILSREKYWIIDIPESRNALGSVYRKEVLTKDTMTYERFRHVDDYGFHEIPDSSITKDDQWTFSKDYSFKRSRKFDIMAVNVFSGFLETINEVKKKVELSELWGLNPRNLNFNTFHCDSSKYYVSRVYLGTLSDFGLQEVKVQTKITVVPIGAESVISQASSMHILKEGALAMMLKPVIDLQGCRAKMGLEPEMRIEEVTPELLENELIEDGYEKVRQN